MASNVGAMQGKICMVTGATSGMGLETSRGLAQRGATVILVGRNPTKCAAAAHDIRQKTGNSAVDFMVADLSSQREVRQLAEQFEERYSRLNVLVNNAGAVYMRRWESVDGIEMTFALNHLGYFLLTNLLLDALEAGAPSRVINVASAGHRQTKINFQDAQAKRGYAGMTAYFQSKLANVLFTYELARRLEGKGVTVNAFGPGPVATDFALNNLGPLRAFASALSKPFYRFIGITAEEAAKTILYLATSPEVEGVTGKYFQNLTAIPSSPASYDRDTARRLWQLSEQLTGLARSQAGDGD